MKIAVFHNLPSGGAKRALSNLVNYLFKQNHLIDVYVPESADENYLTLKNSSNNLFVFPIKKTIKNSICSLFYRPSKIYEIAWGDLEETEKIIANIINHKDYDIVLCEQDQFTITPFFLKYITKPTAYYCAQPSRGKEKILTNLQCLANKDEFILKRILRGFFDKRFRDRQTIIDAENANNARFILTNSFFSSESILKSYGLFSHVSYLGVNTTIFKPQKAQRENFIISVGSCTPSKGFDFIINSISLIDVSHRPKFVIISNYSDLKWERYIRKLAKEKEVDIETRHLVNDNELVAFYCKASLLVYAPYLEPFGLVPLESMACGTPVVGVNEGGLRESIIHNKTGLLVPRNEKVFSDAIKELLFDEKKFNEMSNNAIETINNFWTLDHAGKRLEKLLFFLKNSQQN